MSGRAADAAIADVGQRQSAPSSPRDAIAAHLPEHPEHVDDGLVDAVGREIAEPVEVRLVLEEERPRHGADEIDRCRSASSIRARDLLGRVAREHRAVAVRVRRIRPDRTRRAAFRIRFADHDRRVRELREGRDDGEAVVDRAELVADAHPHEAVRHAPAARPSRGRSRDRAAIPSCPSRSSCRAGSARGSCAGSSASARRWARSLRVRRSARWARRASARRPRSRRAS